MRKILENLAILLVILLSTSVIYLIVKYNMIEDETASEEIVVKEEPTPKVENKKAQVSKYLQNIEGYNDIDVKVDAKEEDNSNKVTIISESNVNEIKIEKVVENTTDTQVIKEEGTAKVDKVGKALDNLLGDL